MKYKVGDKVRIKSEKWYNSNKNDFGSVELTVDNFVYGMAKYCGMEAKIVGFIGNGNEYLIDIDDRYWYWTDDMFEDSTSHIEEKPTISEQMIKDIAEVIKNHNLGVCVSENDGKLIIEPLSEKEEDLPIDTIVFVSDKNYGINNFHLRHYAGSLKTFNDDRNSSSPTKGIVGWKYIIPFDKFNPNDIEESLKYNIVK